MLCLGSRQAGTKAVISGFLHCQWCGKAFRVRKFERGIPVHLSPVTVKMAKSAWAARKG